MRISIIVAMGLQRQIGLAGKLPWHISADLKNFKKLSMGHTLIFGRKTFESIGKALPGRKILILTRNTHYSAPAWETAASLAEALQKAKDQGESEVFIAGGAEIYALGLPLAHRLYLTSVSYNGPADTFFPVFDREPWTLMFSHFSPEQDAEAAWLYEVWEKPASQY